jgi:DNA-binding NarL/FixJ family response regulator
MSPTTPTPSGPSAAWPTTRSSTFATTARTGSKTSTSADQTNQQPPRPKTQRPRGVVQEANREREVVALVAEGLSSEEIAERLFISPATAKTHVSRAVRELRAHDRAQLVVIAYESGLVRPGWHG